ncbi:VWA domain-containing protein [Actinosynnema sp. NPDC004786]
MLTGLFGPRWWRRRPPRSVTAPARWSVALAAIAFLVPPAHAEPVHARPAHTGPVHAQPASGDDEPQVKPVHAVLLVDESGSIDAEAMRQQQDAAKVIAQGEYSPGSTITVVGFASQDGPNQSAVDVVCPTTPVRTAQDQESLSSCIDRLRVRQPAEGSGTDHASALSQALSALTDAPAGEPRIVFLLTDGVLDVSGSPQYGQRDNPERRNEAGRQEVARQLEIARQAGVQVWPLGFGAVDKAQLDALATGGAQATCGDRTPKPTATVVGSAGDVVDAMLTAFSASRCAGKGPYQQKNLPAGKTVELPVDIPTVATDGTILVVRPDPRVTVAYLDPDGREVPKSGRQGDSAFQVSGEQSRVEALRVVNPAPGRWTVRVTGRKDVPDQVVGVSVLWQGAARAVLTVSPPAPGAGEAVTVAVRLYTRKNAVVDPAALDQLSFTARLTGEGFDPIPVAVADDGQGPDRTARDGLYSGTVTVPGSASGVLQFSGAVSGIGITGDERQVNTVVKDGRPVVRAQARMADAVPFVAPGETWAGTISVSNDSGRPKRVRLVVVDEGPGTVVSASPATFDLPASGDSKVDFELRFAANTVIGVNSGTLRLVDDADPDTVWHALPFTVAVSYPPTWLQRLLWLWITLAVLLVAVLVVVFLRTRNRKRLRDVRGLEAGLVTAAGATLHLRAEDRPAQVFRFSLRRGPAGEPTHLDLAREGEAVYELRRAEDGIAAELSTPDGRRHRLQAGEQVDAGGGVVLTFRDKRPLNVRVREPRPPKPERPGRERAPAASRDRPRPEEPPVRQAAPRNPAPTDDDLL